MQDILLGVLCVAAVLVGLLYSPKALIVGLLFAHRQPLLAIIACMVDIPRERIRVVERVVPLPYRLPSQTAMTIEDAYACLGCNPTDNNAEVASRYKAMMRRVHPDAGGSAYLAARVNEARDILQGRLS